MNLKTMIVRSTLLAIALGSTAALATGPANLETAKVLAQPCQACHGADGNSTAAIYPRLAGQYADYLARALHEYREGERVNPIMAVYAEKLSDEDIKNLAAYFAAMPSRLGDLHDHIKD